MFSIKIVYTRSFDWCQIWIWKRDEIPIIKNSMYKGWYKGSSIRAKNLRDNRRKLLLRKEVWRKSPRELTKVSRVLRFRRIRQAAITEKGTDLINWQRHLLVFNDIYVLININNPSVESHGDRQNSTYSLLNYVKEDEWFACGSFILCYLYQYIVKNEFYFRTFRYLMQNYDTLSRVILYYTNLEMKQSDFVNRSVNRIGNKR